MGEKYRLEGHLPVLDGVRGLAVLAVMLYHFRAADLPRWLRALTGLGWTGVDLFFVLSGFLITGILLDTREAPGCLRVFWARRALRIFPLYVVALGLLLVAAPAPWLPCGGDRVYYWLYLNNWLTLLRDKSANHILGHFWSLAVEEQFYLVWPLAVLSVPVRWTARLAAAGIALAVVARCWAAMSGFGGEFIYRSTLTRMDALLAGALCAWLARCAELQTLLRWVRVGLSVACGAFVLVVGSSRSTHYQNPWIQAFGYPALWLGFACFVLDCALRPASYRWVGASMLQWFGRHSYGLYLFHWPIAYAMLRFAEARSLGGWWVAVLMQAAGFAGSCLVAWTSYRYLESPILRLKRYFSVEARPQEAAFVFFNSSMMAGTTSKRSPTIP